MKISIRVFSHESKSAQFEWSFELRNLNDHLNDGTLDHVYANLHRDTHNLNDGPNRHLNCAIQITHRDVNLLTHGPKYCHSNDHSNCTLCSCVKTVLRGFHTGAYVELRSVAYPLRRAYSALRCAYAGLRGNTPRDAKGYARWTQKN